MYTVDVFYVWNGVVVGYILLNFTNVTVFFLEGIVLEDRHDNCRRNTAFLCPPFISCYNTR